MNAQGAKSSFLPSSIDKGKQSQKPGKTKTLDKVTKDHDDGSNQPKVENKPEEINLMSL